MSKAIKKQNKHMNLFIERWDQWKAYLEALVLENNGRLICPQGRELIPVFQTEAHSIKILLPFPICLYNITKKQTQKSQGSLTVFINGSYELEEDHKDQIRRIASEITFYEMSFGSKETKLKLLDSYHFDLFDHDHIERHAPHPTFHAQREFKKVSKHEIEFQKALVQVPSIQNHIFDNNYTDSNVAKLFRHSSFRIPTPQLDVLNLGAVIAADQLVGTSSTKCWQHFQALLNTIHGPAGDYHHVKQPKKHNAKIYDIPRKLLADWYCTRGAT